MLRLPPLVTASLAALVMVSARASSQTPAAPGPHTIVVRLVDRTGPVPYAFEPANVIAQRGDTVRFTQTAAVMHNVRFTKQAPGAKLGAAASGPYLTTKGQTYNVVIDKRFTDGTYEYVCDPHAAVGMKGTLIVKTLLP